MMALKRPTAPKFRSPEWFRIFQKKLRMYFPAGKLWARAQAAGLKPKTVNNWVTGARRPELPSVEELAEKTGTPFSYWFDGSIAPRKNPNSIEAEDRYTRIIRRRLRITGRAAAKDEHLSRTIEPAPDEPMGQVDLDAIDPCILIIEGDSAWPFAAPGQAVVFDAGRLGEVVDGDLVVAHVDDELLLKRLEVHADHHTYQPINPLAGYKSTSVSLDKIEMEYPVVGLYLKFREVEDDLDAEED